MGITDKNSIGSLNSGNSNADTIIVVADPAIDAERANPSGISGDLS